MTPGVASSAPTAADALLRDVLDGLSQPQKKLLPKYFYDDRGARLFERICDLDEYYLTRTETCVLQAHAEDIARAVGPRVRLLEFGSGSGIKTRLLLQCLQEPAEYVPVDISVAQLLAFADAVAREFPRLRVSPLAGDYSRGVVLPERGAASRTVAFFPGSSIGNFEPAEAAAFLSAARRTCGAGGAMILGTDMHKDPATLERAYNDAAGVTAEFNLNLLHRINRECGADFDLSAFRHHAVYDVAARRIEMRLVCRRDCAVHIGRRRFDFTAGEHILTEYSHKYMPQDVHRLAAGAGWHVERCWPDPDAAFVVWLLRAV